MESRDCHRKCGRRAVKLASVRASHGGGIPSSVACLGVGVLGKGVFAEVVGSSV
jgi:hypothetical protein